MQVKIFTNRATFHTKNINHASELNQMEIAGVLLRLHYLDEAINYYNFDVEFTPEHIFKRTITRFIDIKKECIALLQMTITEKYSPRDMTPEFDWGNNLIIKKPFILQDTINEVKHKIFIMSQNIALAKKVNIFSEQQIADMEKERQEVLNFIDSFQSLFHSIYPETSLAVDHNENAAQIEETISKFVQKNIKFESVQLRHILQEISSIDTDLELFGPRFELYSRNFNAQQTEQLNSLIAVVEFLHKQRDVELNFFDFYFGAFTGKILKLIKHNKMLHKFKSFEQYYEHLKSEIISNKSIYDSDDDIKKRLRELNQNKEFKKAMFIRELTKKSEEVTGISQIIQSWCDIFNSAFSEKTEQDFVKFTDMSDCKIASVADEHFVALALKDENGIAYQYRGVILLGKHLENFKSQDKTMSDYLLKDLDILQNNPEKIQSTSFHSIDNILDEINRGLLKDFIFKNLDEKVLFTA